MKIRNSEGIKNVNEVQDEVKEDENKDRKYAV
jgi:hypothetical protein